MANPTIIVTGQDRASQALEQVGRSVNKLGKSFDAFKDIAIAFGKFEIALQVFDRLKGIADTVKTFIRSFDDLHSSAEGLGVTAVQLDAMRTAAEHAGLGAEQLDHILSKLNVRIEEARQGVPESVEYFNRLGISLDSLGRKKSNIEILKEFSDKFKTFSNDTRRAAFEIGFFNERIGPKAAAYLAAGSDALQEYGGVTEQTVEQSRKLQQQINESEKQFKLLKNSIYTDAIPALDLLVKGFREVTNWAGFVIDAVALMAKTLATIKVPDIKLPQPITGSRFGLTSTPGGFTMPGYVPPGGTGIEAPKPVTAKDLAERERIIRETADAYNEYVKAGRDARKAQEEFQNSIEVRHLDEFNRAMREAIDIQEEYRQEGLRAYREKESADAARERARVDYVNAEIAKTKLNLEDIGLVFQSAVSTLFQQGGVTANNFFKALLRDMEQVLAKALIMIPIMQNLKKVFMSLGESANKNDMGWLGNALTLVGQAFGGAKAAGGPVSGGREYLVGERGPELFTPGSSGTITPNGAMGGVTVTQNIRIDSRSDVATIRAAMEAARQLAVRDVGDMMKRRRL